MTAPSRIQPTLDEFKRWAKDCAPAARAVCMAQAYAELTRERVEAYIRPIFDGYRFTYGVEMTRGHADAGQPLRSPKDLYLVDDLADPLVKAFYADCDAAHRAHGFTGPAGHCPALTADTLLSTTENALMDLARPLFGIEHVYGDDRRKYLQLLIGACLKAEREHS